MYVSCLPQELYSHIFQFLSDRRDLLVLLYVSKVFRHEAERILYESVDLTYNHARIYIWFRTIASSPHLAAHVQSLTFGIVYSQIPTPPRPWLEVIAKGLRSLTNLKELNLNKRSPQFIPHFYAWILKNPPFRLKTFRNNMFDLEPTLPFLALQPDITIWYQLDANPCVYNPNLLPLLSDVAIPSWLLPICHSRNITRLHTAIKYENPVEESRILGTLAGFGRELSVLVLERDVAEVCLRLGDFVECLSGNLPLLQNLSLWHHGELGIDSSVQTVVDSLSRFSRLTTLSIQPPRAVNTDSLYIKVLTSKDAMGTASQFFQGMSALTRIAFPQHPADETEWYAKSQDVAIAGDVEIIHM